MLDHPHDWQRPERESPASRLRPPPYRLKSRFVIRLREVIVCVSMWFGIKLSISSSGTNQQMTLARRLTNSHQKVAHTEAGCSAPLSPTFPFTRMSTRDFPTVHHYPSPSCKMTHITSLHAARPMIYSSCWNVHAPCSSARCNTNAANTCHAELKHRLGTSTPRRRSKLIRISAFAQAKSLRVGY